MSGASFEESILKAKDEVLGALAVHEKTCGGMDGDHKCWQERINVTAFLAHCLEMKPAQLIEASKVLAKYNEEHGEGQHGDKCDLK